MGKLINYWTSAWMDELMNGMIGGWMDGWNTHYVLGQYHVMDKYTLIQKDLLKKVSRSSFYNET